MSDRDIFLCSHVPTPGGYDQIPESHFRSLLDRIDILIEVPRVNYEKLSGVRFGERSEAIRQRVQAARDIQNNRFSNGEIKDVICNADMHVREVRRFWGYRLKVRV